MDDERFEKLRHSLLPEINQLCKKVRIKNEAHLKLSKKHNFSILKEMPDDHAQQQTVKPEIDDKPTKSENVQACHQEKTVNPVSE